MAGRRRSILALCLFTSCLAPPFIADASENITYTYDARGRLIQVSRSGTVNDGVQANYSYDKADNRINVTVASSTTPTLSVNDVAAAEGASLVFTVTRSESSGLSVAVNYATSDGTAAAVSDYTAKSGTLTFASGETSKTISVATTDDATFESAETVNLTLSSPTGGATITDAQGIGTMNNNDAAPSFAINDVSITEGGNLGFTVTRTGSTSSSITVNFATANGSASAGSDYYGGPGSITFAPADNTKAITIGTIDDSSFEGAENLYVNLTGATGGATISDAQGVGTINENDVPPPPSFSIDDSSATEGSAVVFTITKTGSTGSTLTVNYATANGSAVAPGDYTATSGTLSFGPTETTKTIGVNTNAADAKYEPDQTFTVTLSGASGGAQISRAQGWGTIYDAWGSLSAPQQQSLTTQSGEAQQQSSPTTTTDPPPDSSAGQATNGDSGTSASQGGQ